MASTYRANLVINQVLTKKMSKEFDDLTSESHESSSCNSSSVYSESMEQIDSEPTIHLCPQTRAVSNKKPIEGAPSRAPSELSGISDLDGMSETSDE
jgi:hypothetical protein